MRQIDLKNFQIRTDLVTEILKENDLTDGIKQEIKKYDDILVRRVEITSKGSKKIGKKPGCYITIEYSDITDTTSFLKVKKVLKEELNRFHIKDKKILLIGLGNAASTPDALGPDTMDEIVVTSYLEEFAPLEEGFSSTAIFKPGVTGETGIETSLFIQNVVNTYKPELVIVIDALASRSLERVCKTIQISDAGITPGSGVGNNRKEISKEVLNVPVLAIGVPTVVDAVSVVSDTLKFLTKKYSFQKKFSKLKKSRFITSNQVNYLKEEVDIEKDDKEKLLGMVGTLEEEEVKSLLYEVLTPIGYNLMITPKEIDFVIKKHVSLLSQTLNECMHPKLENKNT